MCKNLFYYTRILCKALLNIYRKMCYNIVVRSDRSGIDDTSEKKSGYIP